MNAWEKIPDALGGLTVGPKGSAPGLYDVVVPQRFFSGMFFLPSSWSINIAFVVRGQDEPTMLYVEKLRLFVMH